VALSNCGLAEPNSKIKNQNSREAEKDPNSKLKAQNKVQASNSKKGAVNAPHSKLGQVLE
jgi:hypothetical protein